MDNYLNILLFIKYIGHKISILKMNNFRTFIHLSCIYLPLHRETRSRLALGAIFLIFL